MHFGTFPLAREHALTGRTEKADAFQFWRASAIFLWGYLRKPFRSKFESLGSLFTFFLFDRQKLTQKTVATILIMIIIMIRIIISSGGISMRLENKTIEFKREYTDDLKYAVVAFANTDGGKIYVGTWLRLPLILLP